MCVHWICCRDSAGEAAQCAEICYTTELTGFGPGGAAGCSCSGSKATRAGDGGCSCGQCYDETNGAIIGYAVSSDGTCTYGTNCGDCTRSPDSTLSKPTTSPSVAPNSPTMPTPTVSPSSPSSTTSTTGTGTISVLMMQRGKHFHVVLTACFLSVVDLHVPLILVGLCCYWRRFASGE